VHPRLPTLCRAAETRDRLGRGLPRHSRTKESSRRSTRLEDSGLRQSHVLAAGQVTSLFCRARVMASARLETPNLDRMLLT
jgi:hypothetical protein